MSVEQIIQELSQRAHAVRSSVGTSRQNETAAALQESVIRAYQTIQAGKPSTMSQALWDRLKDMADRAMHTLEAEGVAATAEDWTDILNARMRALRTTPNQTTAGALLEAINRSEAIDPSRYPQDQVEELEDQIRDARIAMRSYMASAQDNVDLHITDDPSGAPTGAEEDNILKKIGRWLWPADKKLLQKPGFMIGAALGTGAVLNWRKKDVKKFVKRLKG